MFTFVICAWFHPHSFTFHRPTDLFHPVSIDCMQMWVSMNYTGVCLEMECIHPCHAKSLLFVSSSSVRTYVPSKSTLRISYAQPFLLKLTCPQPTASFQRSSTFEGCERESFAKNWSVWDWRLGDKQRWENVNWSGGQRFYFGYDVKCSSRACRVLSLCVCVLFSSFLFFSFCPLNCYG